ncbi:MAG: hypothetical protein ABIE42_09135 [Candidatus Eisenbacteria bacterium]
MTLLSSLLSSKKFRAFLLLLVCATVLAGVGKIDWDQWTAFAEHLGYVYIGGQSLVDFGSRLLRQAAPATEPTPPATEK